MFSGEIVKTNLIICVQLHHENVIDSMAGRVLLLRRSVIYFYYFFCLTTFVVVTIIVRQTYFFNFFLSRYRLVEHKLIRLTIILLSLLFRGSNIIR